MGFLSAIFILIASTTQADSSVVTVEGIGSTRGVWAAAQVATEGLQRAEQGAREVCARRHGVVLPPAAEAWPPAYSLRELGSSTTTLGTTDLFHGVRRLCVRISATELTCTVYVQRACRVPSVTAGDMVSDVHDPHSGSAHSAGD